LIPNNQFELINEEKKKKNAKYTSSGIIEIISAEVIKLSQKKSNDKPTPEAQRIIDKLKQSDSIRYF
jgi:hypothetical protein